MVRVKQGHLRPGLAGAGLRRCAVNSSISVPLCVPLQLCEDLFSRVSKNQSAELSYSVEVSPGLGRGLEVVQCPLGREEVNRVIKTKGIFGVRQPGI